MRNKFCKSMMMILIIIIPILFSCATTLPGRQYTEGSIIDMGHFSVIGPPGDGWFVNIQKGQLTVEFMKRNVSQSTGLINDTTMIKVFRNWITDKRLKSLSEEEVADDFRANEEAGMLMMGVMRGLYELSDVKKGTTMIGDKKLYFMSYRTSGWSKGPTRQKWISDSVLCLFFPADFKEKYYFYCFQLGHLFMQGFLEKGDLTPIISVISNLQIKSPQQKQSESRDAQFYYNRGNSYAEKRQYDKVISDFKKAYEVDPKAASILTNQGKFYMGKYQYDEAISVFTKALEIDPRFPEAYNMRGFVYGEKGQYDKAISDLNKALEVDPRFAEAYNNRGLAYWNKGQFEQAISDFNKAIEIDPKPASFYFNRGMAYVEKSQYDQAISDYSKALEIDPKLVEAYTKRGWAYIRKGHYDQAISDCTKALDINSWFAVAYTNRGIAYYFKKEYDKSWEDIKRAQDLGHKIPPEFLEELRKASGREK